jgi:hypothetical protein
VKITLIRTATIIGFLALSVAAHASPLQYFMGVL